MNWLNMELNFWARILLFYFAFILSSWLAPFSNWRVTVLLFVLLVLVVWRNWLRFTQDE